MKISYKNINRMVENKMREDKKYRREMKLADRPVLSDGRKLSDEEITLKLRSFGLEMDREIFRDLSKKFLSAEDMTKWAVDKFDIMFNREEDGDWIWIYLAVLWERWSQDRPSLEMIDDRMQEGYERLKGRSSSDTCRIWLNVWKDVVNLAKAQHAETIYDFDEIFIGTQSVFNWVQDLKMELGNAGNEDRGFFHERIKFCNEFFSVFPGEDSRINENMRRALAESFFNIGQEEKADSLFEKWLQDDPRWGWGWIGWSNCYSFDDRKDYARAEKLLNQALSIVNIRDREYILEKLAYIYRETGRKMEAKNIREDKNKDAKNETAKGGIKAKVGRNDPCPCGSGKKFKKCCGR